MGKELENKYWLGYEALIDGALYLIKARNASVGVWNAEDKSFLIARKKFGSSYLSKESHWDTGAPYGTAKPVKLLDHSDDWVGVESCILLLRLEAAEVESRGVLSGELKLLLRPRAAQ